MVKEEELAVDGTIKSPYYKCLELYGKLTDEEKWCLASKILSSLPKGGKYPTVALDTKTPGFSSMFVKTNGGMLEAYTSVSDYDTKGVGISYAPDETDGMLSIARAEVKRGELARENGMSELNRDVELYIYGDVECEDYTNKQRFKYTDVLKTLRG